MRWKSFFQVQTRNPQFLWRMVLSILGAGLLCAVVVQWLPNRPGHALRMEWIEDASPFGQPMDPVTFLESVLAGSEIEFSDMLDLLPALGSQIDSGASDPETAARIRHLLATSTQLEPIQQQIALALWDSLGQATPAATLTDLAEAEPRIRYSNWALGLFWHSADNLAAAAAAYAREGQFEDAMAARRRAILLYLADQNWNALKRLRQNPQFKDILDGQIALEMAIAQRDWWTVWWAIPRSELEIESRGSFLIALLTGLFWALFCFQAGLGKNPRQARFWIYGIGIGLGVLSIWPTLFAVIYQDRIWHMEVGTTLAGGLRYFLFGVGLREELCKLLLLVPLLPWLVRRRNDLEMLIASACVGLGFAAFENIQYFGGSLSTASVPRYLTANFFHMAATGLCGLWLGRAILWPRHCGTHFVAMLGLIVLAHGFYDAFLAVPALAEYSLGSIIIYILLCYQFFHELRQHRTGPPETISLTANFLAGVAILTSITLVYASALLGLRLAVMTCILPAVSTGLMVYLFLREMPESMVRV